MTNVFAYNCHNKGLMVLVTRSFTEGGRANRQAGFSRAYENVHTTKANHRPRNQPAAFVRRTHHLLLALLCILLPAVFHIRTETVLLRYSTSSSLLSCTRAVTPRIGGVASPVSSHCNYSVSYYPLPSEDTSRDVVHQLPRAAVTTIL